MSNGNKKIQYYRFDLIKKWSNNMGNILFKTGSLSFVNTASFMVRFVTRSQSSKPT